MGSAWQEVSALHRPGAAWGCCLALVLVAACGGDRETARAGEGTVATADTAAAPAAPEPMATDTAAAAPAGGDTAASGADTAGTKPTSPGAAIEPSKPAATPAPTPKPAPVPKPVAEKTAAPKPATPAPSQDTTAAAQDTPQTTQAAPMRDAYHQAPKDTVDQATYDGWKQYNLNCARCHGEDVLGSTIAPHLVTSLKPDGPIPTQEAFVQVVCAGRPEKGMPSWCALGMDPAKINQIYAYVKGRSEGKIGAGRPARREGG
jgi:Cytochrome C oxidase, cbb3-type, subunit III